MTATATQAPKFRYIGTTDECIVCQQCGKEDLKATVVLAILDEDGNEEDITYYGSSCAARALAVRGIAVKGGGRAVLRDAQWARERTIQIAKDARTRLAYYGLPENGEPTADAFKTARRAYARNNFNAGIHRTVDDWIRLASEHMAIWQRSIADAKLIGWD